jgi:DNA mismatch repair protein MutL
VERGDELFIIDQHALAERIIYERLKAKAKDVRTQKLIIGKTIPLDEVAFSKFLALKDELLRQGFIFKILQEGTILILGVPDYLAGEDVEWVLRSLLEEEVSALDLRDELLKKASCLLARKKGELFSEEEKLYLVERMFRDSLFTCPHGRPIFYKLSLSELKNLIRA